MKNLCISLLMTLATVAGAHAQKEPYPFLRVKGGTFRNTKSHFHAANITVRDFYIGRYEVTQKEWVAVMGRNPSRFRGDDLPVENVSGYDCVEYCNSRSLREGLTPYYNIDKDHKDPNNSSENDDVKWTITVNVGADGYRLPTEAEWEYAAGGGQSSKNYVYSGSNTVTAVGWYWENAGDKPLSGPWIWHILEKNNNRTRPVGRKVPNELGLYDMSGNVREWCWDGPGVAKTGKEAPVVSGWVWKGGGWIGAEYCCASAFQGRLDANGRGPDQGFRLCRDAPAKGL